MTARVTIWVPGCAGNVLEWGTCYGVLVVWKFREACVRGICVLSEWVLQFSEKMIFFFFLLWYNTHDVKVAFCDIRYTHCVLQASTLSTSRTFSLFQKRNLAPLSPPPGRPPISCLSMDLPILNILYTRNHAACGLVRLASLAELNIFKVHPGACAVTSFRFTAEHAIVCIPDFIYPLS